MFPRLVFALAALPVIVLGADPAFGRGPPAGAGGPPAGVTVGPPPSANAHVPSGVAAGNPHSAVDAPPADSGPPSRSRANAASLLGGLNAAHASATAREHANPNSMVGDIATYESQMGSALKLTDAQQQASAITAARQQLASSTNRTLTVPAVTRLDQMLGIKGANPSLGTSQ